MSQGAARGRGRLAYEGVLGGLADVGIIETPAELAAFDLVLIALPGHAYPAVLPLVVPHLQARQPVIVSGALSLAPLWIYEHAGRAGARPPVAAWGTTLATARHAGANAVCINTLRAKFEVVAIPASANEQALAACRAVFGDRFVTAPNILATALRNVNPVAHATEMLTNLTRIEKRETWPLFDYLTPAAARIGEAIDAERQAIARGFGLTVRSINEHTHLSYHVPLASYADMAAAIHVKYAGPPGLTIFEHRYFLEDVPYGLAFFEALARAASVPAPNISAVITLFSTVCGRDFRGENPLLAELKLEGLTPQALLARCAGTW